MRSGPDIIWVMTAVFVFGIVATGVAQSALLM